MKSLAYGIPEWNDRVPSSYGEVPNAAPLLRLAASMTDMALRLEESRTYCASRVASLTEEAEELIVRSLALVSKQRMLVRERRELLAKRRQLLETRRQELRQISAKLRSRLHAEDESP